MSARIHRAIAILACAGSDRRWRLWRSDANSRRPGKWQSVLDESYVQRFETDHGRQFAFLAAVRDQNVSIHLWVLWRSARVYFDKSQPSIYKLRILRDALLCSGGRSLLYVPRS